MSSIIVGVALIVAVLIDRTARKLTASAANLTGRAKIGAIRFADWVFVPRRERSLP